ncbi:unnamed protein product [Prorocentrum cordatum]|uniref:Secreted protein n=1 Tax=Prorocentrum cordatum TaxID=2364126 RepID=A0ABN9QKP3_9DINO|nr:unnamed protein product [Polarella glacialis]
MSVTFCMACGFMLTFSAKMEHLRTPFEMRFRLLRRGWVALLFNSFEKAIRWVASPNTACLSSRTPTCRNRSTGLARTSRAPPTCRSESNSNCPLCCPARASLHDAVFQSGQRAAREATAHTVSSLAFHRRVAGCIWGGALGSGILPRLGPADGGGSRLAPT